MISIPPIDGELWDGTPGTPSPANAFFPAATFFWGGKDSVEQWTKRNHHCCGSKIPDDPQDIPMIRMISDIWAGIQRYLPTIPRNLWLKREFHDSGGKRWPLCPLTSWWRWCCWTWPSCALVGLSWCQSLYKNYWDARSSPYLAKLVATYS